MRRRTAVALLAAGAVALSGCALKPPGGYHKTASGVRIASSEDTVSSAVMNAARTVPDDQLADYHLPAELLAVPVATNAIQRKLDKSKRSAVVCAPLALTELLLTEPRLFDVKDMTKYLTALYGAYYSIDVNKPYIEHGQRVLRGQSRKRPVPAEIKTAVTRMTELLHGLHVQAEYVDDLRKLNRLTPALQRTLLLRIVSTMAGPDYTLLDRQILGFYYGHCVTAEGV